MKIPYPLLLLRFKLRGQALQSMAEIIERQEREIDGYKNREARKDQLISDLQSRITRCH